MKLRTYAPAVVCLAALLALAVSPASAGQSPLKLVDFTAKAKVTVRANDSDAKAEYTADYWSAGRLFRSEMTNVENGGTYGTLIREPDVYSWIFGQESGRRITKDSPDGESFASFDDIARCLGKAKSAGEETVDGVATTKWTYKQCAGKGDSTIWIAKSGGFVKKMQLKTDEATITVLFTKVEPAQVPNDKFLPPARVPFIGIPTAGETPKK